MKLLTIIISTFLTSSVCLSETINDLYVVGGISDYRFYKKFTDTPFTGNIIGIHQGYMKNGRKEGVWVQYWEIGRLRNKGSMEDGKRTEEWIFYWDNGQYRNKINFINGKEEGLYVEYDKDGNIDSKGKLKNGKREGRWVY